MNRLGIIWIGAIALWFMLFVAGRSFAFHEGGVGYCAGCHDLHDSQSRSSENSAAAASSGKWMLKEPDASSTCLACHAEQGQPYAVLSNDGSRYTPGGDFYWVKKSYSWVVDGRTSLSAGDRHGHNVVAAQYGLNADTRVGSAPGGTFPASDLGCTSCHDPHARVPGRERNGRPISASGSYGETPAPGTIDGNYRLLGGLGYQGVGQDSAVPFSHDAPIAVTGSQEWTDSDANHPAYGSGMSEWCANCHSAYLNQEGGMGGMSHTSGASARLGREMSSKYNAYVRTGNLGGSQGTAYLALVPFEAGTSDRSRLDSKSRSGPDPGGNANVMCLSCHRAHASAFQSIGRWDFEATFLSDSHPAVGDAGATPDDVKNRYYGRDLDGLFGRYQRQLCNKCHAAD